MMRASAIVLITFISQVHAKEDSTGKVPEEVKKMADNLSNTMIDKLLDRLDIVLPPQDTDLDDATLGKAGNLAVPRAHPLLQGSQGARLGPIANAKKAGSIKLIIPAGQANPAPPVGPAIGARGLNLQGFCKEFNDKTKDLPKGQPTPTKIYVYADRSFDIVTKTPTAHSQLLEKMGTGNDFKASATSKRARAELTLEQCKEIADLKKKEIHASHTAAATRAIISSARSAGLIIKGD